MGGNCYLIFQKLLHKNPIIQKCITFRDISSPAFRWVRRPCFHCKEGAHCCRNVFPQKSDSSNLAITPFLIEKITELPFLYIHKKVQYFGVSSDVLMGKLVYTHSLTAVQSLMQIWYHYEATFFLIMAFSQTNWRFGSLTILASLLIKSLSIKERPLE